MVQQLSNSVPNGLSWNNGIVAQKNQSNQIKSNRIYLSKFHLKMKISTHKNVIYLILNSWYIKITLAFNNWNEKLS